MKKSYHNVPGTWTPEVQVEFEASGSIDSNGQRAEEREIVGVTIEDVAMPKHIVKAIADAVKDSSVLSQGLYDADIDTGAEQPDPWEAAEDAYDRAEFMGEER